MVQKMQGNHSGGMRAFVADNGCFLRKPSTCVGDDPLPQQRKHLIWGGSLFAATFVVTAVVTPGVRLDFTEWVTPARVMGISFPASIGSGAR